MAKHQFALGDGTPVPSVTAVLANLGWRSEGLIHWAYQLGRAGIDLDEARRGLATVGSICHAWAAADIQGLPQPVIEAAPDQIEQAKANYEGYQEWRRGTKLELLGAELALVSARWKFGGRLDAVVRLDGEVGLLDFKSSKALYPEHVIQVAAYTRLWDEARPDLPLGHWHVLRWAPDGGYSHHRLTRRQIAWGWAVFRRCLELEGLKRKLKAR